MATETTREQWRKTALAAMADYIDAGSIVAGICDLYGRKRIYQYDLLLYAFGALWIVFAQAPWMLLLGYFILGLTVGADVPASWTLITETAPKAIRGKLAGLAQVLWYV